MSSIGGAIACGETIIFELVETVVVEHWMTQPCMLMVATHFRFL